jgi:NADPH:quinone reductase-like Zn-dependent oxidoreductase
MDRFNSERREALAAALALAASPVAVTAAAVRDGASRPSAARGSSRMRSYQVGAQQGIASLAMVERPVPLPGPGEVLVAVRASALNHRDLAIIAAHYGKPKPPTRIPLGDGAGEVVEVGPGVTRVKAGDRVTAPHFATWIDGDYDPGVFDGDLGNAADGWLTERALLPAAALVPIPPALDFVDAAALGAAGVTAWTVLETLGRVKAGDTVLALGTGGVAVLALQIAKMNGARVAITSSSDEKLAVCRKLGADITVNYRNDPDWPAAVRAATGGRGVDVVVETVGLATLTQSLSCCAPNARVGLVGALGTPPPGPTNLMPMLRGNLVLKGITSGSRRMLDDLLRACEVNGLKPHVDRVFPFDEARAAYEYLEAGDHVGKVVIRHG